MPPGYNLVLTSRIPAQPLDKHKCVQISIPDQYPIHSTNTPVFMKNYQRLACSGLGYIPFIKLVLLYIGDINIKFSRYHLY